MDFLIFLAALVGAVCGIAAISRQSDILRRLDALEEQLAAQRSRVIRMLSHETPDAGRQPEPPAVPESAAAQRPEPQPPVSAEPVAPTAAPPPAAPAIPPAPVPTPADAVPVPSPPAFDSAPTATAAPAEVPEIPVAAPALAELPVAIPADEPRVEPAAPEADSTDWLRQFEERVGKRWMTWLGVLALVIGALFFLQYAVRQGWIVPPLRIGMAVLLGAALVVIGGRFLRREMRALGQGLIGGGLAILYGAFFAAFAMYHLMPQPVSFAAMVAVSGLGLFLAVRHDALPVSFIAVLGGFITPLILRSGENQRDLLFTYLLVLDLTVLAVAFFRQWAALLTLSFLGTTALFLGWYGSYYEPAAMVPTLLWLGAFYMAFLLMPFAQHFARRRALDAEQFAAAHVAAVCAFIMAARILWPDHEHALGFIALGMSALYAGLGAFSRLRVAEDRRSLLGFSLLSMTLLTLSVPLHFGLNGVTVAWAVEGPALVALGFVFRYQPVRVGGFIVLGVAVLRVFFYHWPMHTEAFTPFLNRDFAAVFLLPASAAVCAWLRRLGADEDRSSLDDSLALVAVLLAGVMATVIVDAEVRHWVAFCTTVPPEFADYWRLSLDVVIWSSGAAGFLVFGARLRHDFGRVTGLGMLAFALLAAGRAYIQRPPPDAVLALNLRFVCVAAAIGMVCVYAATRARRKTPAAIVAGYLVPAFILAELHTWIVWAAHAPLRTMGYWTLSCDALVPAVASASFTTMGCFRRVAGLRIAALPLLAVALIAVFCAYGQPPPYGDWVFVNLRFAAAAATVGALFAVADARRRLGESAVGAIAITAGLCATLLVDMELRQWLDRTALVDAPFRPYWLSSADTFVWAVGGAAFLLAGRLARSIAVRVVALPVLSVAAVLSWIAYSEISPSDAMLFLNVRFIACAATPAVAFAACFRCRDDRRDLGDAIFWSAVPFLLLLLSLEDYLFWTQRAGLEPHRAGWVAQMSLSLVWGLYATALLAVGFWRRNRALRFCGLALFGITALKLVIIDIAHVHQIYRIVSFLALGVLMIAASYLYHRIEKRLKN